MAEHVRALPELGKLIGGKYRLVRRLGEGGMGVVFEALHERIQQRVAIKMLLPEVLAIDDVVSRFEREARAAGQLRSENAARVLDVDTSQTGIPFMVMEFLDGNDLSAVLEARGQLPIAESVDYVLQACIAMAEAHAAGIIHRDLKPSNLFLCGGDRPIVKVLDFGISKIENDKDTRVTATQTTVGTPLYMSPEQIRSAKHVDSRTDIWSLGIILYELLAGKTPFEGSTAAAAAAICIDTPPALSTFRPDIPPLLERMILRALEKNVTDRYQDVQSLAAAIAPFGTGSIRMSGAAAAPPQSLSRPTLTPAAREELISARTLAAPSESGALVAQRNNATLPGWVTRPGAGKSKGRTVIVAASIAALVASSLAVLTVLAVTRRDPAPIALQPLSTGAPPQPAASTAPTTSATAVTTSATSTPTASVTAPPKPSSTFKPPVQPATGKPTSTASTAKPPGTPTTPSTSAPIHL